MAIKRKFLEIELPIINHKAELLASNEEELIGKTIRIDLTRRLRGKSAEIIFKIKEGRKAMPQRLFVLPYFIRRMMRKSINYVEDSFLAECQNAMLRVKPFLITRKKVSRAVRNALRNEAKEEITKTVKNQKVEEIFSDLIANKFQKNLSLKLKKIYPLAFCDIRDIFIEKEIESKIEVEKIK